jgi:ABC-type glycerol-3-phosphate transport system substrate-binding protein
MQPEVARASSTESGASSPPGERSPGARVAEFLLRPVHLGLVGIVTLVVLIGALEPRCELEDDFDPERDAEFAATWDSRVHIEYWEKWGSFERDAAQAMVDAFNRSQDEIFVHFINISEVDRKTMLAVMGADPPEVVGLWAHNIPHFAEAGALIQLDDLMESTGLTRERYTPNYLKICMANDKVFALPTTPATVGLYYNKTHFREKAAELRAAGLDPERPPRNIAELDRYAAVFNDFAPDGTPNRMGFLHTEPGWFHWTWGFYFGGRLFDEDSGQVLADDPPNVEALLWAKRYAEAYGREKLLQFRAGFGSFDSPQNAFIDGRVTMEIQGVWFSNFIRRHRPHMEFGVAPAPSAPGVPGPVSQMDSDVIVIPRGCKHVEAAWRFVDFTQREGLAILCRLQGKHMPVKRPPPNFREGHPNLELEVFERIAASPYTFIQPRVLIWREYSDELNKAFEHVWNWPPPEDELEGLEGDARRDRAEALCREEIVRTLEDVRERMQRQYDAGVERRKLREARGDGGRR